MALMIDTNALLAFSHRNDKNHLHAKEFLYKSRNANTHQIVPAPVLSELFYMTTVRINYQQAITVFAYTQAAFHIEALTPADMTRMTEIMTQYEDAKFDYVDVAIMAVAERLQITQICTFDRRDFSIFRPKHCDYFELLP